MSRRQAVVFDNWSKGDSGRTDPSTPGTFSGINVITYPDGSIGPRPGARPAEVTGLPASPISNLIYVPGAPEFGGSTHQVISIHDNLQAWRHIPDYLDAFNFVPAASLCGTLGSAPKSATYGAGGVYTVHSGAAGYKITQSAVTALPAMPVGDIIVYYKDSLVIAQVNATSNRIRWSAPADPTTWPAANFMDIGNGSYIAALYPQRDGLTVVLQSGEVWVISGPLTPSATLRRVGQGSGHPIFLLGAGGLSREGTLRWVPDNNRRISFFTGGQVGAQVAPLFPVPTEHLLNSITTFGVVPTENDDICIVGGVYAPGLASLKPYLWFLQDGSWTRHSLGITSSGTDSYPMLVACALEPGRVLLAHRKSGTPALYATTLTLDSPLDSPSNGAGGPGVFYGTEGSTGLPATASWSTHEWWSPGGENVTVVALLVEVQYDVHLASEANTKFSISVDALNRLASDNESTSAPQSWVPAGLPKTPPPGGYGVYRQRAIFRVGDQGPGAGFRVSFSGMRGCTIRRITAEVDVDDGARY